ncbi:hypothetical protein BDV96DRAFT_690339 [Lophiotrema nucula]|uniref:Uncharacterized protein n=1 Tax=Lophiotrema nucula TaxID=690887 RepID=A0A6A5YZ97_9PLEO|nr:hypothetical protein BDV96DRAFT_690339 [Lophiotrema nucula]
MAPAIPTTEVVIARQASNTSQPFTLLFYSLLFSSPQHGSPFTTPTLSTHSLTHSPHFPTQQPLPPTNTMPKRKVDPETGERLSRNQPSPKTRKHRWEVRQWMKQQAGASSSLPARPQLTLERRRGGLGRGRGMEEFRRDMFQALVFTSRGEGEKGDAEGGGLESGTESRIPLPSTTSISPNTEMEEDTQKTVSDILGAMKGLLEKAVTLSSSSQSAQMLQDDGKERSRTGDGGEGGCGRNGGGQMVIEERIH